MKDRTRHGRTFGARPPATIYSRSCPCCGAGLHRGYGLAYGGMGEYVDCPRCDWYLKVPDPFGLVPVYAKLAAGIADRVDAAILEGLEVGVAGTGTHEKFDITSASILSRPNAMIDAARRLDETIPKCPSCSASILRAVVGADRLMLDAMPVVLIPRSDGRDRVVDYSWREVVGSIVSSESGLPEGGYVRGRRLHDCPGVRAFSERVAAAPQEGAEEYPF